MKKEIYLVIDNDTGGHDRYDKKGLSLFAKNNDFPKHFSIFKGTFLKITQQTIIEGINDQ